MQPMRRTLLMHLTAFGALIALPLIAHAASTGIFDPIIPSTGVCTCPGTAPGWGCVLQVVQNLENAIIPFAILLLTVYIGYAGIGLILSPTNEENRSKARARIINAIIGILIVLVAWLLVDSIMKVLYDGNGQNKTNLGPWNSILTDSNPADYCLKETEPGKIPDLVTQPGAANSTAAGGSGFEPVQGGTTSSAPGGKCPVQSSGPCSAVNFSIFGTEANTFSRICFHESSNGALLSSTVDKTTDGRPLSFGLFQINISVNAVGGLNCPDAFNMAYTSKQHNVYVTNEALYQQCKSAALDSSTNIQNAHALYVAHGLSPWTADKIYCGNLSLGTTDSVLALASCMVGYNTINI